MLTFEQLPETSTSLIKKYLTRDMVTALEHRLTDTGFSLAKAIQSGLKNPDSDIGIYAGDAQSYQTFATIFDPIICEYHGVSKGDTQPSDIHAVDLTDPDPEKKYILSTRIRVARNVTRFSFTSHIDLVQRKILEQNIVDALGGLQGDLQGSYHPFGLLKEGRVDTTGGDGEKLQFEKGDRFQDAAGINSDFPQCRGIFYSTDKHFRVWVNEEDHLRVISQDSSSDLSGVFNLLGRGLVALEQSLDFAKDDTYGYLTSCPTNIGTSMRAGVHIRLEKLNRNRALLAECIEAHDLQIRGTRGEKTRVDNGVFDISNRRRFGISEVDIVKNLHQGLLDIIETEKKL